MSDANKKISIIAKMRIPISLLEKLAHNKGRIGRESARLDSWQSRHFDKGKGLYKELYENRRQKCL
jgi:hypothetical protein